MFLDIGFSNKRKSCGMIIHDDEPQLLRFNAARELIVETIAKSTRPLNLTIEAPLSVAFDTSNNPTRRSIEKQAAKTRYWYNGLGCAVMVAAMYLVRKIHDECRNKEVRLFEGFVSYKDRSGKSNHRHDVQRLRQIVQNPAANTKSILDRDLLRASDNDKLTSAFCVAGIDCGIPPVIKCDV